MQSSATDSTYSETVPSKTALLEALNGIDLHDDESIKRTSSNVVALFAGDFNTKLLKKKPDGSRHGFLLECRCFGHKRQNRISSNVCLEGNSSPLKSCASRGSKKTGCRCRFLFTTARGLWIFVELPAFYSTIIL